jgi:hypothetical protein
MDDSSEYKWSVASYPQSGELLESWLMRLSFDNWISARSLIQIFQLVSVVGSLEQIDNKSLTALCKATAIDAEVISALHLGTFFAKNSDSVLKAHQIPTKQTAQTAVHYRVCPNCFAEQKTPYILLDWALDWTFFCNKHGQPLLETCPQCGSHFQLNLLEQDTRPNCCWKCGFDVAKHTLKTKGDYSAAIAFQTKLYQLKTSQHLNFPDRTTLSAQRFVKLFDQILRYCEHIPNILYLETKLLPNQMHLLDDTFSISNRRLNGFLLLAWALEYPTEHLKQWQLFLGQVPQRHSILLIQALQNVLDALTSQSTKVLP